MSLSKEFFNRETNITAKVIADSISDQGIRITTLEVEAPRIILAEINTHNAISKNCSSSRAIPIAKMMKQVKCNGFTPLYWGSKKAGMQAGDELFGDDLTIATGYWEAARSSALLAADSMEKNNLHKQLVNRATEPFQMVKQVLTATDWDNFFNLRIHPDAQPEILMLAYKIHEAMSKSRPINMRFGEYHLPYVDISQDQYDVNNTYYHLWNIDKTGTETDGYKFEKRLSLEDAIKYSIARCASVSYRTEGMTLEKSQEIYKRLLEADVLHSSPAEHIATPINEKWGRSGGTSNVSINQEEIVNVPRFRNTWQDGITHMNRQGELCSANFRGWVQYRHTLKGNTCWKFDFEERMKMFD